LPSPVHPYSDYGVALRTLRGARSWLALTMVVCVVVQFLGFALMWWTPQPYEGMKAQWRPAPTALSRSLEEFRTWLTASQPATAAAAAKDLPPVFYPGTDDSHRLNIRKQWATTYTICVPLTQIASLIAISSQAMIVFITLLVVLVAQAPGVAQITRSLIWSVLLLFMFLPWQYFARDFPIPGVIYSYAEMLQRIGPLVVGDRVSPFYEWMVYARFIAWPVLGVLALVVTAERYRAGVMIAIGHPLQSILQPRSGVPQGPLPGTTPRGLVPPPPFVQTGAGVRPKA
jgi:hypothetical protein